MNSELGTITEMLSLVTIVVALADIFITSPFISPTSILSPTFIGCSNNIIIPEMKLLVIFCNPNPNAQIEYLWYLYQSRQFGLLSYYQ
jgi:hypothetical protein